MYIQVTNRCNMNCAHCCYSYTEKGHDMNMAIYRRCVNVAACYGDPVSIGGGEPTLHPRFLEMLCYAIGKSDEIPPWVSTNGTHKNITLMAIKLNLAGAISLRISMDQFHNTNMISDRVKREIARHKTKLDISENRTTIMAVGRGKQLEDDYEVINECVCPDIFIDPFGDVYFCGCKSEKIGTYKDIPKIIKWKAENCHDIDCWRHVQPNAKEFIKNGGIK